MVVLLDWSAAFDQGCPMDQIFYFFILLPSKTDFAIIKIYTLMKRLLNCNYVIFSSIV